MTTDATLNLPLGRGRSSSVGLWLVLVVVLGYWAVTIWRLGGMWSAFPEYSYGWAVPMLCVMLFLERWRTRSPRPGETTRLQDHRTTGPIVRGQLSVVLKLFFVLTLIAFILARMALEVIPTWRFAAWTLAFSVIVLTLLMLRLLLRSSASGQWSVVSGPPSALHPPLQAAPRSALRASHFAFPICFFLLAVPWPSAFEVPFIQTLTQLNAAVTVELLAFLKIAAVRMGNIILIEPGMVGVQEACSGIRSFQSTVMVALFLGELFRFTFWRRVAFVVVGAMLSFGFNIVRTSFLVWTCNRDGLGAVDKFHDPAGWTILAASVTGLGLIGWWLYRGTRSEERGAGSGERTAKAEMLKTEMLKHGSPGSVVRGPVVRGPSNSSPWSVVLALCFALVGTELGLRWWFATHEQAHREVANWTTRFESEDGEFKSLKITREVQGMLQYNHGGGWEWQGGGAERWQAFLFTWDRPATLAERILSSSQATGHEPELCFTRAGMQLRQIYGRKRFTANGVPLVFKVYEFADRNIPIFVFSCIWERGAEQTTSEEDQFSGAGSTSRGLRQAIHQLARGDRGITGEVRVLKFGMWGPRAIGEAEAAFQQQLNTLIQPKS